MKSAIAVRNVAYEDLGSLAGVLDSFDYKVHYLEAGMEPISRSSILEADLVVLLGGPISVNDGTDYPFLHELLAAVSDRVQAERATLGLCLGAQLIAQALGAAVYPSGTKEIGWSKLELTGAGRASCLRHLAGGPVLHWHGETFDIPAGAEHLASTAACKNQAFSHGPRIMGLQFHPEVTQAGLERWYIGHTLELAQRGIDIPRLRSEARAYAPQLEQRARACFGEWLAKINSPVRE